MSGNRGRGRPKGSPNKVTANAKEAIEKAFEGLGGVDALMAWAKGNQDSFYGTVWPKILPLQVKHSGDRENPVVSEIIIRGVRADADD